MSKLVAQPSVLIPMTRQICILLSFFIISGHKNIDRSKTAVIKQITAVSQGDTTFKLEFFREIPDTIDGCGEYFTYDTNRISKNRYIFLSNLTEFAIIKINDRNIYLKRDSLESKEINDKSYIAVYKGHYYKAVLKIKQTKTYDEGGSYSGTLQIIGKNINRTFKVHGEAGC
jgi:hypothetical protein